MLVIQCANGHVAWVFVWVTTQRKAAHCLNDAFRVEFDPEAKTEWATLLQSMVAHSVAIRGAFQNSHWLDPLVGDH